jgi:DNA-binding NarL/FixJ family response regulator
VRAVVADDVMLTRAGIVHVLSESGIDVVAEATDGDELWSAVERTAPDVAIVDIRMPPTHTDEGIQLARRIRREHPSTAVLVLSHHIEPVYAAELLADHPEGTGYLLKDRILESSVLFDALRRLADGETVVDPTIVARLVARRRAPDPLGDLSPRELEVLGLVAEGLSNRAIAARLYVGERTVEAHVTHIFLKLGLDESPESHRRVLAVLAFLRN